MSLVLYPLLTAAFYYLGAHATITAWMHTRYPDSVRGFMECAACSGTWYGFGVAVGFGYGADVPFLGLPGANVATVLLVGLCSMVWTPLVAALHLRALLSIHETQQAFADHAEAALNAELRAMAQASAPPKLPVIIPGGDS
jgi:hypothetical protein